MTIAKRVAASSGRVQGIVLLLTLGFTCMFFYDGRPLPIVCCSLGFLVAAVLLRQQRQTAAFALLLFYAIALLFRLCPAVFKSWPLYMVIPLAGWAVLIQITHSWPAVRAEFAPGCRNRATMILAAISISIPPVVLDLWARSNREYLHEKAAHVPHLSPSLLYLAGIGFATVNAALEEMAFRGVIHGGLKRILGRPVVVVPVQAIVFGAAHISGVPGGTSGVLLASLYGLFLGMIRESSGGLLWPILTHIFADAMIFSILIHYR